MFKIKNYTGNGIKVNGNVKIDENGIATLFTTPTDYIKTNLKALDVMNSTEFQIKFKTSYKLNRLVSSISSNYTVIKLDCISSLEWDNSLMYLVGDTTGHNVKYFFKTQLDIEKYYNQWLYIKVTNNNNNRTLTLSDDKNILVSLTSNVQGNITENQDVILGQSRGNSAFNGNQTLQIDLSETYFKNNDKIISQWNL